MRLRSPSCHCAGQTCVIVMLSCLNLKLVAALSRNGNGCICCCHDVTVTKIFPPGCTTSYMNESSYNSFFVFARNLLSAWHHFRLLLPSGRSRTLRRPRLCRREPHCNGAGAGGQNGGSIFYQTLARSICIVVEADQAQQLLVERRPPCTFDVVLDSDLVPPLLIQRNQLGKAPLVQEGVVTAEALVYAPVVALE